MKFGTQKYVGRQETVAYGDSLIFNAFCLLPLYSPLVLFLYFSISTSRNPFTFLPVTHPYFKNFILTFRGMYGKVSSLPKHHQCLLLSDTCPCVCYNVSLTCIFWA